MNFWLKKTAAGRVYISQIEPKQGEEVLAVIDAEDWIKARDKTQVAGLEAYPYRPGYGFYTE